MKYYDALGFGAVGDGVTDDGEAIQAAVDKCFFEGGGTVVLKSGYIFKSRSIELKKNVELHVQKGAVLKASEKISDYFRPCSTVNDPKTALSGNPVTKKPSFAFIHGFEADGAVISGGGTIDGNCYAFVERKSKYYVTGNFYPRPTMIYLEKSRHITITGVTLQNAPFWTVHPMGCEDVLIDRIRILNPLDVANSDGIDPDHCRFVRITDCHIECADDCICLKNSAGGSEYGKCEGVIISGCTLVSTSAAIKIGTEGIDGFSDIIAENCVIKNSNRGISIQIRDCGSVENVSFSNIMIETRRFCPDFWGTAEPVAVTSLPRDRKTNCGTVKNVRFKNISCKGENGVLIFAAEDGKIEDISFDSVSVSLIKTSRWDCGKYDLRPGFGFDVIKQKSSCFFIKNARNIRLGNVSLKADKSIPSFGELLLTENAPGFINAQ